MICFELTRISIAADLSYAKCFSAEIYLQLIKFRTMKTIKRTLLIASLALICSAQSSMAQITIRIRPQRPHVQRPAPPSPAHVWIEEDWAPRGNRYEFRGGRWEQPPRGGATWVPGHWRHSRRGYIWVPGQWRTANRDRHRGYRGQDNSGHERR